MHNATTTYSQGRLLASAMASTFLAAAAPTIWIFLATTHRDLFQFAAWIAFSALCLVVGAAVSFLVLWPVALLLESRPVVREAGIVLGGTLAWPGALALTLWLTTGAFFADELLALGLVGALIGLATSSLFAVLAGFRGTARSDRS